MSNLNQFQDDQDFVQNRGDPYYNVDDNAEYDLGSTVPSDNARRTANENFNQGVVDEDDLDEITDTDQMLSNRFRDTTQQKASQQGLYNEDRLYGEGEPANPRNYDDRDMENRVRSEVAASHRQDRSKESRQASAKRASDMYQNVVGDPLEIDEQGRVVTE